MDGRWRVWWPVVLALGCGPTPAGGGAGSSSGADPTTAVTTTASVDDATTVGQPWMPGSSGGGDGSTAGANGSSSTGAGTSTGGCAPGPIDCGGVIYACGDTTDNDGDGLVDLDDPDCTGPCDDAEDSLQTGLPGDNDYCDEDCFFDGNHGQGDDMCTNDLRCDPANPGALIACEYTGGLNCSNGVLTPPECVAFCEPLVAPGCDCFGCCEFWTEKGPQYLYLESSPDCSVATFGNCQPCTPHFDECGVPCDPNGCQWCIGLGPPQNCEQITCAFGDPCQTQCDCGEDAYCYLGCCHPKPPG